MRLDDKNRDKNGQITNRIDKIAVLTMLPF